MRATIVPVRGKRFAAVGAVVAAKTSLKPPINCPEPFLASGACGFELIGATRNARLKTFANSPRSDGVTAFGFSTYPGALKSETRD